MCLAIPGRVVEIVDRDLQMAKVEVGGVRRNINLALIDEEENPVRPGDWVLIHVGFAMSRIDEAEAERTLDALEEIGAVYRQELKELHESRIE
jgi:hydrogenase expression/formation protein HypC